MTLELFRADFTLIKCAYPEVLVPMLVSQIFLFYVGFLIFECTTLAKGAIRAQRILYLRRFSTYSLSCFVFGYYLTPVLRTILNKDFADKQVVKYVWWEEILYLFGYFGITFFLHLALDSIEGRFTPDWFLKVFAHMFSFGRRGVWKPITQNHLDIKHITLLSKELE